MISFIAQPLTCLYARVVSEEDFGIERKKAALPDLMASSLRFSVKFDLLFVGGERVRLPSFRRDPPAHFHANTAACVSSP